MISSEIMHIGIVVPDLEVAIAEYSAHHGRSFTRPRISHSDTFEEDGVRRPIDVRYAYSHEGPPYYELIEAHDSGLYGPKNGVGFHHIGVWEHDCDSRLSQMVRAGMVNEATYFKPEGGLRLAYLKLAGAYGIRHEIMDAAGRVAFEEWIAHH